MEGVRCISEQRWEVPTMLEWGVKGTLGGHRWLWLKNNHRCLRQGICYSFF